MSVVQAMVGLTTLRDGFQHGIVVAFDGQNWAALPWIIHEGLQFDYSDLDAATPHSLTFWSELGDFADYGDLIGKVNFFVEQSNWREQVAALLEHKGGA